MQRARYLESQLLFADEIWPMTRALLAAQVNPCSKKSRKEVKKAFKKRKAG